MSKLNIKTETAFPKRIKSKRSYSRQKARLFLYKHSNNLNHCWSKNNKLNLSWTNMMIEGGYKVLW